MGRRRPYVTNAARQEAYRARQRTPALASVPQVHLGPCTLYQGDTRARGLTGYDYCLTDPPYEAHVHAATQRTQAVRDGSRPYAPMTCAPLTAALRRFFRTRRCGGGLVFCPVEAVARSIEVFGTAYKRTAIWEKPNSAPQCTGDRPAMACEHLVCAWQRGGRSQWEAGGKRGVYVHLVPHGPERVHATQNPVALLADLLRDFTKPGDGSFDPFLGSGSTGLACLQEGRRFLGIEQDPATYALACARMAEALRQGQLCQAPGAPPRAASLFAS